MDFFIIEHATCGIFMQSKPSCKDEEPEFFYYYLSLNLVLGTLMRNPTKKNSCSEPKHLDVNYISIIKLPV